MVRRVPALIVAVFLVGLLAGPAIAKVVVAPLVPVKPRIGVLFEPTGAAVRVVVKDERPDKDFIAVGLIGPAREKDKGILLAYATPRESDLAEFVKAAAEDAVAILGMKVGEGATLEITIMEFVVDMYRLSGFTPMNCMGYGKLGAVLTSAEGVHLAERRFDVAFYERRSPGASMKEVATYALSQIYMQAARQVTAQTLVEYFAPTPDMSQVVESLDRLDTFDKEYEGRQAVLWFGITGLSTPEVRERLMTLFREAEEQRVHQAAAESLGMLGVDEVEPEIVAVLSGERTLGEWDNADNEQVWYLLRALAMLGETDLTARIPDTDMRMPSVVEDLIVFEETGEVPTMSPKTQQGLVKARQALVKKRR